MSHQTTFDILQFEINCKIVILSQYGNHGTLSGYNNSYIIANLYEFRNGNFVYKDIGSIVDVLKRNV